MSWAVVRPDTRTRLQRQHLPSRRHARGAGLESDETARVAADDYQPDQDLSR